MLTHKHPIATEREDFPPGVPVHLSGGAWQGTAGQHGPSDRGRAVHGWKTIHSGAEVD